MQSWTLSMYVPIWDKKFHKNTLRKLLGKKLQGFQTNAQYEVPIRALFVETLITFSYCSFSAQVTNYSCIPAVHSTGVKHDFMIHRGGQFSALFPVETGLPWSHWLWARNSFLPHPLCISLPALTKLENNRFLECNQIPSTFIEADE